MDGGSPSVFACGEAQLQTMRKPGGNRRAGFEIKAHVRAPGGGPLVGWRATSDRPAPLDDADEDHDDRDDQQHMDEVADVESEEPQQPSDDQDRDDEFEHASPPYWKHAVVGTSVSRIYAGSERRAAGADAFLDAAPARPWCPCHPRVTDVGRGLSSSARAAASGTSSAARPAPLAQRAFAPTRPRSRPPPAPSRAGATPIASAAAASPWWAA